jgi:hypothetical protein
MADRIRMKSKTVMNNPLITSHAEGRADTNTVIEGDEFSTSEIHAGELEALNYAERTSGDAAEISDRATKLIGSQTSKNDAIASNRAAPLAAKAPIKSVTEA